MSQNHTYYILEFTFDVIQSTLQIVLTKNPDHGTRDKEIVIPQIISFQVNRYHPTDNFCLGDFTGLNAFPIGKHWRYILDTGDAKVTFDSMQVIEF